MATLLPFKDKTITITGAARGIGLGIARYLAARGANVCISDVLASDLDIALQGIQKDFPDVKSRSDVVDVTKPDEVEKWILDVKEKLGKIDGSVNNAGILGKLKPITETTMEEFVRVLNVNVLGLFNCLHTELKVVEKGGSIVNIASVAGLIGVVNFAPYISSKHAALGLTKTAAREAWEREIRVNAICPGLIETNMLDEIVAQSPATAKTLPQVVPRPGTPYEIGALAAYLLGEESGFTTGSAMVIDGGTIC